MASVQSRGDNGDEADCQDLEAQGFLRLLQQLRIVLLQDSVVMRQEFPAHPIWADPIFAGTTIWPSRRTWSSR